MSALAHFSMSIYSLKSELAALDRKIAAELAPKHDEESEGKSAGRGEKASVRHETVSEERQQGKPTMVAEPRATYRNINIPPEYSRLPVSGGRRI